MFEIENHIYIHTNSQNRRQKQLVELAQRNALFQKAKGKDKIKLIHTTRILQLMQEELKLKITSPY